MNRRASRESNSNTYQVGAAGLLSVAVAFGFSRYGYGLFVPILRDEFSLSTEILGFIASGAYVIYLLAMVFTSFLVATRGPRLPVVLGGLCGGFGMLLVAVASDPFLLSAGVLLAGASGGFSWAPFTEAVKQLVPQETQGRTLSFISTGTTFGLIVAGPVALIAGESWRLAWVVFAACGFLAAIWNAFLLPAGKETDAQENSDKSVDIYLPWQLHWTWFVSARSTPLFAMAFVHGLVGAFYWTYAVDLSQSSGLPRETGPIFWTLVGIVGIVGIGSGDLVKLFGLRKVVSAFLVMLGCSIGILGLAASSWTAVLISASLYGASFMVLGTLMAVWSSIVFPDHPATGFSMTLLFSAGGEIVGPTALGIFAGRYGLGSSFIVAAALTFLAMWAYPRKDVRDLGDSV